MSDNMKLTNIWAIRDARGLNVYEKMFLETVESRGIMKSSEETARADMGGIDVRTYRKTRDRLEERGLLNVGRFKPVNIGKDKAGRDKFETPPNYYKVNINAVRDLIPAAPVSQDEPSWSQETTSMSHDSASMSQNVAQMSQQSAQTTPLREPIREQLKITKKDNSQENLEENSAVAPCSSQAPHQPLENESVKDNSEGPSGCAAPGENPLNESIQIDGGEAASSEPLNYEDIEWEGGNDLNVVHSPIGGAAPEAGPGLIERRHQMMSEQEKRDLLAKGFHEESMTVPWMSDEYAPERTASATDGPVAKEQAPRSIWSDRVIEEGLSDAERTALEDDFAVFLAGGQI